MARSDKLYDNPRSKVGDEPRVAKKGDTAKGEFHGDKDGEYESLGPLEDADQEDKDNFRADVVRRDKEAEQTGRERVPDYTSAPRIEDAFKRGKEIELWRRKKREVPTS